ncbi:aconitate hydratase AcnA [Gordonia sp. KTR9]|uniref:aconitate hydratase AcnA n=1 Tax=Gordonia sp. KTR9 TaxID=337191 RepID=UPI00027DE206|nr:aconitate hydratase AcnA [Gordonia sp. KTR9]AFR51312.1 Aconitase hydratase [Gordonia sp. KTR9]
MSRTEYHGRSDLPVVDVARRVGADVYRQWPTVIRLLAENVSRHADAETRDRALDDMTRWLRTGTSEAEIPYVPGRLLMHDTTSTPALVDIAAMRDAVAARGGDPTALSPRLPVEVSVDHSLAVESFARRDAAVINLAHDMRRNAERYRFLSWASKTMDTVHINPPGTGIMHTINLEQLATVVTVEAIDGVDHAVPDMMLGTDSHTPMINGLGVLGWGIGGLEAETVMFGMPTTLRIPEVVGVRLTGTLSAGVMATDLALVVTHRLREIGVTGEFVEFFGPGVSGLSVGERAVIANMAPEYGATTGFFPVDARTVEYLADTGRSTEHCDLVESVTRRLGLWFDPDAAPRFTRTIDIDLDAVVPSVAGPRRPQDLVPVTDLPATFRAEGPPRCDDETEMPAFPVAIASITSCTNTSDPRLLIAAGLVARRARERGMQVPPYVKTSLAPGSPSAAGVLERAGLVDDLSAVGFDIVGFGCATCIGNSGPLPAEIIAVAAARTRKPVAVLSGNRNFPGRVHPDLELGLLMSPPMVIVFALAGDAGIDPMSEPIGIDADGRDVMLADLWPAPEEINALTDAARRPRDVVDDFAAASRNPAWDALDVPDGPLFPWDPSSTALRRPPFADDDFAHSMLGDYHAHPLLVLADDITTDHISPAGAIHVDSPTGRYLVERGEASGDLNVYASRRGNWEAMLRGGFQNKNVHNALAPHAGPAQTVHAPTGTVLSLPDAARRYADDGDAVVIVAGERYGMGSSRDWAAKLVRLLGVRAVLARSFERIHRSNLIGVGVLPLLIPADVDGGLQDLRPGDLLHIVGTADAVDRGTVAVVVRRVDGTEVRFDAQVAVETDLDRRLLRRGGVIPSILDEQLGR